MISGTFHEAAENCTVLGYYAASTHCIITRIAQSNKLEVGLCKGEREDGTPMMIITLCGMLNFLVS
jgi:hypothetical protein